MADEAYTDLPEEDEQAFMQLEKKFRAEMNEELNEAEQRQVNNDTAYLSYINRTVAAAKTPHLGILQDFEIPSHRVNLWDAYQEFNTIVEHYMVQIQIAHGRRVRGYSVRLDPSTKSKIRHYLEKIREIVDRLEVPLPKKEALSAT